MVFAWTEQMTVTALPLSYLREVNFVFLIIFSALYYYNLYHFNIEECEN